ncbi:UNVERIFIED_CONTAM: putative ribonuclease H protein [Sesamum latifolium]|uniref:Ribonuclease H protein n=1 Tax=Sesamum latifolium TaxID=2727402 RepID=A0AAW2VVV3_9LAMI
MVGRKKRELFGCIRDRVWKRVEGWKEKLLSQARKEILMKAIIQAIPSYCMSCFLLPESLLRELEGIASNFFWNNGDKSKIHWVAWPKLCTGKKEGGLGFRNLRAFNLAMLAKQGWCVLKHPDLLICQIWKARYFPHCDFFHAGHNASYTWRSVWEARNVVESGVRWRIGNGRAVRVWDDGWLDRPLTFKLITPHNMFIPDLCVE